MDHGARAEDKWGEMLKIKALCFLQSTETVLYCKEKYFYEDERCGIEVSVSEIQTGESIWKAGGLFSSAGS